MSTQTQILTTDQIADQIMAVVKDPSTLDAEALRGLIVIAARTGKLAGLLKAQEYVSSNWPQGQYEQFNEHRLNNQIKGAIKRTLERIKN